MASFQFTSMTLKVRPVDLPWLSLMWTHTYAQFSFPSPFNYMLVRATLIQILPVSYSPIHCQHTLQIKGKVERRTNAQEHRSKVMRTDKGAIIMSAFYK